MPFQGDTLHIQGDKGLFFRAAAHTDYGGTPGTVIAISHYSPSSATIDKPWLAIEWRAE